MKKRITAILLSIVMFFGVFASFGASVFAAEPKVEIDKATLVKTYNGGGQEVSVVDNLDHYTIYATLEKGDAVVRFIAQDSLQKDMKAPIEATPEVRKVVEEIATNPRAVQAINYGDKDETFDKAFAERVSEFIYLEDDAIIFDAYNFIAVCTQTRMSVDQMADALAAFRAWLGSPIDLVEDMLKALNQVMAQVDRHAVVTIGDAPVNAGLYLAVAVGTMPGEGKGTIDAGIMIIKPEGLTIQFNEQNEKAAVFAKNTLPKNWGAYVVIDGVERATMTSFTGMTDEGEIRHTVDVLPEPGVYTQMAWIVDRNYYAKPVFRTVVVVDYLIADDPDNHLEDGKYVIVPGYHKDDHVYYMDEAYIVDPKTGEVTKKDVAFDKTSYDADKVQFELDKVYDRQTVVATVTQTVRNTVREVVKWVRDLFKSPK